jgi:putative transposase
VHAHLEGKDDGLVTVKPVLDRVRDFAALIADQGNDASFAALRAAEQTGRPLGTADFIEGLERVLGRPVARRAPGRKPAQKAIEQRGFL